MKKKPWKPLATLAVGASLLFSAPAWTGAYSYPLEAGDTFWTIATRQGISLSTLMAANPGLDPERLSVGQRIEVPIDTYTVREGDTYWSISQKLRISMNQLMDLNPEHPASNLYDGVILHLPSNNDTATALSANTSTNTILTTSVNANTVETPAGLKTYSRKMTATASAYTASADENGGWAGLDYFGNSLQFGTIAVDPKVIPLGSTVYVTGYKHEGMPKPGFIGKATDTGGAIKGNRIDIFLPQSKSQAMKFGLQNVTVYILETP